MKTIIIAEAGVNHNGDIRLAKELIDVAASAGADYVKFQTFKTANIVTKSAKQAEYQVRNLGQEESQHEMLRRLELSEKDHLELIEHCRQRKIAFFSTAFDFDSLDFLRKLGLGLWKIPSGEITNLPFLEKIAAFQEPIILSTGMATLEEIGAAIEVFKQQNYPLSKLTVLHCTTEYPAPYEDINLLAMRTIAERFNVNVGYSDHSAGIEVSLAAAALGATVIEKHFTLSRDLPGPDHRASLEPQELRDLVRGIRNITKALGSTMKGPSAAELKNIEIARKSIVASRPIRVGETFCADNITTKRPGTGISPMRWYEVLGRKATRDYAPDELIQELKEKH